MRALGPLIFSFGLTFSGAVPTFESPDRWFAEDKAQHFFLSFALTNAGYGGARLVGISHRPALVTAGVATAAAGLGKEIYDERAGSGFSVKDLVWDGIGIAAGIILISYAR